MKPPLPPRKNFIQKLQSLEEGMKRRILIVGTAVTMVAVVYIWVGYFNNIIVQNPIGKNVALGATTTSAGVSDTATITNQNIPGFWSQFAHEISSVYHDAMNSLMNIKSSLGRGKEYQVSPN